MNKLHYNFSKKLREVCQENIQGEFHLSCCTIETQDESYTQYNIHTRYSCPKFEDLIEIPEGIRVKVYGE